MRNVDGASHGHSVPGALTQKAADDSVAVASRPAVWSRGEVGGVKEGARHQPNNQRAQPVHGHLLTRVLGRKCTVWLTEKMRTGGAPG